MATMQGLSLTGVPVTANIKKRADIWRASCLSHVQYMHKLLSSIYDGIESDEVYEDETDDIKIEKGDSTQHSQIFADHCYRLINHMSEPTSGPVELPLTNVITVLSRCLKVSYSDVLAVPSRSDLSHILPHLHQASMDVLSQLILCCGSNILPNSHLIIDLCLQTIVSTRNMSPQAKCVTRSSVYQALVLWIRTCGWGKYLSTHSKLIIQELTADTQPNIDDRLAKKNDTDTKESTKDSSHRKKKGKKKKGGKGDSYGELEAEENGDGKEKMSEERVELVQWAFSLSQLLVENLQFSASQNLVSHITKTASTVQRLSLSKPDPYSQGEARQALYQALASCLLSPLDYGSNRNNVVCHYATLNSGLDLLTRACHSEDVQTQSICSHALDILRASTNLKGPVIRKTLDFEDTSLEDIGQLMREKEQMTDNVEELRKKLMTSEVENEQQSRLIASLRERISELQSQNLTKSTETTEATEKLKSAQTESEDDDDDDEDDKDMNMNDERRASMDKEEEIDEEEKKDNNKQQSAPARGRGGEPSTAEDTEQRGATDGTPSTNTKQANNNTSKKRKRHSLTKDESEIASTKQAKGTSAIDSSPDKEAKRSKPDTDTQETNKQNFDLQDMLGDFVDAPPDSS